MSEIKYIKKCLQLIECKINWGDSGDWVYDDFRKLQEMILDASGTNLSVHTLERLFGKLKTHKNYNPQSETKKALAVFLGYDNWTQFKEKNAIDPENSSIKKGDYAAGNDKVFKSTFSLNAKRQTFAKSKNVFNSRLIFFILAGILAICAYYALNIYSKKSPPANLKFEALNVYGKRPHTVKFAFELAGVDAKDISIDFGVGKSIHNISNNQKHLYKTYLSSGIHTAHLKADGKIIASTKIFIDLEGWKGYTYTQYENLETQQSIPDHLLQLNGRLYTPRNVLDSLANPTTHYFVEYLNVANFGVLGDNMTFETRFRNNDKFDYQICFDMWFKLIGTHGVLKMHFLKSGCAGFVQMIFGDKVLNGHKQDLSAFTKEFFNWKRARMEVIDKKVNIYFENTLIYTTSYNESVGKIMGISITSKGGGETDYVRLYNKQKELVYSEDF